MSAEGDTLPPRSFDEEVGRSVGIVCRAVVAVVMCMTGSCAISDVFSPQASPDTPQCAHERKVDGLLYPQRCQAPAAFCGAHGKPEAGQ